MENTSGILQVLKLHTNEITSCDFNKNFLLATGSSDKQVRVMEWKPGLGFVDLYYSPFLCHKYGVTCVRFSQSGTLLASSSLDGRAVLHSVENGDELFTMVQSNTSSIRFCNFTPDSTKLITAGDNGVFCFWDLVHRTQIRSSQLHDEEDYCVKGFAVSPDSEYLLSADSKGTLKLWYIGSLLFDTPQCIWLERNIHDGIFFCDFSPIKYIRGKTTLQCEYFIATCGADSLIKIWKILIESNYDSRSGSQFFHCDTVVLCTLKGHEYDVFSVRFDSSGNYVASTGLDKSVKLWHIPTETCIEELKGHTRFGTCSAFSKDSAICASGSNDKTVIIWDLKNNLTLNSQLLKPCNISIHFTSADTIHSYNQKFQMEKDKTDKQGNKDYKFLQKLVSTSAFNTVCFVDNNLLATAGGDKSVTIWRKFENRFKYKKKEVLQNNKYSINHLDVSRCGTKIISCSMEEVILFWDLNIELPHKMKTPDCTSGLRICRFSPNSKFIAAAGDNQIIFLWDATTLEFIRSIKHHENALTSLAFTPDSKFLISTCSGGSISSHKIEDQKCCVFVNNTHDLGVTSCDISAATISKNEGIEIYSSGPTFYYNENYLLATCGNDSLVKLWQIKSSELLLLKTLFGHGGTINYIRFSSNDPLILASCGSDCTVRIWHSKSEHCLQVLNGHNNAVTTCSFSAYSSLLATGSLDKTVIIWILSEKCCPEFEKIAQNFGKPLERWTTTDISRWFINVGCQNVAEKIKSTILNGAELFTCNNDLLLNKLGLENQREREEVKEKLLWLKKESIWNSLNNQFTSKSIPHKFLCPITHDIMKDPVICSDGYTYERAAIIEWLLNGKFISPVTKNCLQHTALQPYSFLKRNIWEFLFRECNILD